MLEGAAMDRTLFKHTPQKFVLELVKAKSTPQTNHEQFLQSGKSYPEVILLKEAMVIREKKHCF